MWFKPKLKLYVTVDEFNVLKEMYKDITYLDNIANVLEEQNQSITYINGLLNAFSQKEQSLLNKLKPLVKSKKLFNIDREAHTEVIKEHLITKYHLDTRSAKINRYVTHILKSKGINRWYNLSISIDAHNAAVDGMYASVEKHISYFLKHVNKLSHVVEVQNEFDDAFLQLLQTINDITSFYKYSLDGRLKKDRKVLLKIINHMTDEIKLLHAPENN